MYIERDITALIHRALKALPVVVLTGPRQAGKSTLLQHDIALKRRRYLSLDDPTVLAQVQRDPGVLLDADEVTIDEAHRAPDIFLHIKRQVDAQRRPGRFLLSGSANFLLLKSISESLAGRAVYLNLSPLTWRETVGFRTQPALVRILSGADPEAVLRECCLRAEYPAEGDWIRGGFPPARLLDDGGGRRLWFAGYEQTYLDRDLRQLTQVADLGLFQQFVHLAALRTGQVLNVREVARDCGANPVTISRWIGILETGFLARRLAPYFSNRVKRLVKSPKWYLRDSGLAAFLCGLHSAPDLRNHVLRGAVIETYVCQNLSGILDAHMPEAQMTHYRSHAGFEVDFVVEAGQRVVALEVKAASRVDERDLRGAAILLANEPRCVMAAVLYCGRELKRLGERLWAVPLGALLA